MSHLQNWLSILAIVLRSWITHTTSFKHTVSGMCGQHILKFLIGRFSPQIDIFCSKHNNWGLKFAAKIVINTFFNNKQTVSSDSARKDTVFAFTKPKEPNNWFSFIAVLCFCYPELVKCLVTLFVCSLL